MKNIYRKLRIFFPGRKFSILVLNILGLFVVSLFEMLGVAAILPIVNLAMGAPITGYLQSVADLFGNPNRTQLIVIFGVALVLAFVFKGVLSLVIKRWSLGFIATQQSATSVNLLNRYMREPYLVHRKRGTAAVLNSVTDIVGQAYSAFVNGVMSFIGDLLSIVVLMVMLLVLMPLPALFAFAYFGVTAFVLQYVLRRKNTEQGEIILEATRGSMNAALDAVIGFREIRMHGVTERYLHRYQSKRMDSVNANMRNVFLQELPKYTLEIIFILGIAALLAIMSMTQGADSAPYLLLFAGACIRILPNYTRIVASLGNIRAGEKPSDELVREIGMLDEQGKKLDLPHAPDADTQAEYVNREIEPIAITVENLSFTYPDGNQPVLKNINLQIPMGT